MYTIPTPTAPPTPTPTLVTVIGVHRDDPDNPWTATFTTLDRLYEYVVNVEDDTAGEDEMQWTRRSFAEDFTEIPTLPEGGRMWELDAESTFTGSRYVVTESVINPVF